MRKRVGNVYILGLAPKIKTSTYKQIQCKKTNRFNYNKVSNNTDVISTVKYQKRLTPLLVIVQERVKTVPFC